MGTSRGGARIGILIVAMVMLTAVGLGGCQGAAEQAYGKMRLGEPVGTPPAEAAVAAFGWCVTDEGELWLPRAGWLNLAQALVNDEGRVVARSLVKLDGQDWGLWKSGAMEYLIETEVPEEAFVTPTAEWTTMARSGEDLAGPYIMFNMILRGLLVRALTTAMAEEGTGSDREEAAAVATEAMDAMTNKDEAMTPFPARNMKLSEVEREYLAGRYSPMSLLAWASGTKGLTMTDEEGNELSPDELAKSAAAATMHPQNVAAYVLYMSELMGFVPVDKPGSAGNPAMFVRPLAAIPLWGLVAREDAFAGVTRPGYRWKGSSDTATMEVRRLEGRRVRVRVRMKMTGM